MVKADKVSSFKVGDVVKLPSEAKRMTVVSVDDDKVQCVWLNHQLSAQYHDFESGVLVNASPCPESENPSKESQMEN